MTMAAGRKNTAPKRRATTARGGRPSGKSGPPKAAGPVRPKTPTRKVAQTATPGRPQTKRARSSRIAPQVDAGLTARLESMAQELAQIRDTCNELRDVRRLVETLTGMVEALVANQRVQTSGSEQEVTSEEHHAPAEAAGEPDTADDQQELESADSMPSELYAG